MSKFIISILVVFIASCATTQKVTNDISSAKVVKQNKKVDNKKKIKHKEYPQAISLFIIGMLMENSGQIDLANNSYKMAAKIDTNSLELIKAVIRTTKDDSSKLYWVNRYRKLDSTSVDMDIYYANLLMDKKEIDSAVSIYRRVRTQLDSLDPLKSSITYRLALAYDKLGNIDSSTTEYNRLISLGDEFSFLRKSVIMRLESRPKKLDSIYGIWFKSSKNKFDLLLEWGYILEANNMSSKAIGKYLRALNFAKTQKDSATVFSNIGSVYLENGNIDSSNSYFTKCLAYDSLNLSALINVAYNNFKSDSAKSDKYLKKALSVDSTSLQANYFYALLHMFDSNSVSEKHLKQAIKKAKNYVPAYIQLGYFYSLRDMIDKSDSIYNIALSIDSTNGNVWYYLGFNRYKQKDYKNALKYYKKAQKILKEKNITFEIADIYAKLNQNDTVLTILKGLIDKDSSNSLILNYYGYMLIDLEKDLELGKKYVLKALEKDSLNGAYLDSYGWYFYKKGDYKTALKYITKAYKIVGGDAEILEHLGDINFKLNKKKDAIKFYEKALKFDSIKKSKIKQKLKELKH